MREERSACDTPGLDIGMLPSCPCSGGMSRVDMCHIHGKIIKVTGCTSGAAICAVSPDSGHTHIVRLTCCTSGALMVCSHIWGRGAMDLKFMVIALLEAAAQLIRSGW